MKTTIMGMSLGLFICSAQAVDIHSDKALEEELAYLHAENYVYSAGKKLQKVNDVAAAAFVISKEEIRRSGATTIPDTLRLVPGVQVAQIDANKWAISVRGLNARFSTELLVLIDGRAVYTPIFSGVFWHREDTPLDDIERIEVIRGAGAAMWGANAVNGVINIITKNAKDTQGGLISVGGGNQENGFGHLRYGGKIGDDFHYRVYGKGFKRNHNVTLNRENPADDTENYQGGFKTQWQLTSKDTLITQADIYHSRTGDIQDFAITTPPYALRGQDAPGKYKGGNIQTRWQHTFSDTSNMALQVYYKHDDSNLQRVTSAIEHEKTLDIDFQHRFRWLEQHDMMWGLGYRNFDHKFHPQNNPKVAPPPPYESEFI
jgi:iron complex outermembrane receptor protein